MCTLPQAAFIAFAAQAEPVLVLENLMQKKCLNLNSHLAPLHVAIPKGAAHGSRVPRVGALEPLTRCYLWGQLGAAVALRLPSLSSQGEDGNLLKSFISNLHLPPF